MDDDVFVDVIAETPNGLLRWWVVWMGFAEAALPSKLQMHAKPQSERESGGKPKESTRSRSRFQKKPLLSAKLLNLDIALYSMVFVRAIISEMASISSVRFSFLGNGHEETRIVFTSPEY